MYALDPLFATLMVHGDSTRSSLVAVGVVDPVQGAKLVSSVLGRSIKETDIAALEEAVQDKRVRKVVVNNLAKVAKKNKLNGWVAGCLPALTRQIRDDQGRAPDPRAVYR